MVWYAFIAYFFAGAFLANGVPHFVHGISGRSFQTPFASPPGVGESPPLVNVFWGGFNFAVGGILLTEVGQFRVGLTIDSLLVLLGLLVMGSMCAKHFEKVRCSP
jgi:hypothetical protein